MRASFSASSNRPAGMPVVSMLFTGSRKPSSATCASVNRKATCGAAVEHFPMGRTVSACTTLVKGLLVFTNSVSGPVCLLRAQDTQSVCTHTGMPGMLDASVWAHRLHVLGCKQAYKSCHGIVNTSI